MLRQEAVRRGYQFILIGSTLLGSWLGMQAVHELGHVLGAWATGAEVRRVVLSPTTISRTDVVNNAAAVDCCVGRPRCWCRVAIAALGACTIGAASGRVSSAILCRLLPDCEWTLYWVGLIRTHWRLRRIAPAWCGRVATVVVRGTYGSDRIGTLARSRRLVRNGAAQGQVSRSATYASVVVCVSLLVLGFAIGGE